MRGRADRAAPRYATALALVALAATALLLGRATEPGAAGARLTATSTGGGFTHSNSRDGQPLFTAAGLAPGGQVSGTVTLQNTGGLSGRFTLSASDVIDVPGAGGGILSGRLQLSVRDVTVPAQPLTIYDGGLAPMAPRDVGVFAPGQARSFEFVATMPDGGAPAGHGLGDNAFQGAQASARYVWDAVEHGQPPSGGLPAPRAGEPAPSVRSPASVDRRAPRLRVRVPRLQRILQRGYLELRVRCDERCRVSTRASLTAGHLRLALPRSRARGAAGRTLLVKVRVPRRHRGAMRRALTRRRTVTVRVAISARDRVGNRASARRTLRVRAGRPARPRSPGLAEQVSRRGDSGAEPRSRR